MSQVTQPDAPAAAQADGGAVVATMVDAGFTLGGDTLPRDHRRRLADALRRALPGLAQWPGAGVHRINVSQGGGAEVMLSQRSRLTLRLPRSQVPALEPLVGRSLDIAGHALRLGAAVHVRELLPYRTLYAHLVAAADGDDPQDDAGGDELAFMAAVNADLAAMGLRCRPICGRRQHIDDAGRRLPGFSLMLDGLSAADALQLLEAGLGPHRLLGCGLFVPHRSAAAVA
jgi:CRISPR-associated protein Cas6